MLRLQVDILVEGDETLAEIAEFLDLTEKELCEFNPQIERMFSREYQQPPKHARIGIKVCRHDNYPSVVLLAYGGMR